MNLKAYFDGKKEAQLKKQGIKLSLESRVSKLTPQQKVLRGVSKWLSDKAYITASSTQGSIYWRFNNYPSVLRLSDHLPNYLNVIKRIFTDKRTYADVTHFMSVITDKITVRGGQDWWSKKKFEEAIDESSHPFIFINEYVIQPDDTSDSVIKLISNIFGINEKDKIK